MKFFKAILMVQAALFVISPSFADEEGHHGRPPNIIFIFTDDLGYGDLECYKAPKIKTPNIDRISKQGMTFTEFYSASPVCSPSRAALLTGRYPIRQGIHHVFFPESYGGLPPSEVTIAEVLKDAGYATGMVGKWHLGHREKFLPLNQGFDEFFGVPYSNDMGGFYYIRGNEVIQKNIDQRFLTQTYTREALKFIETHYKDDNPFFLYLAHSMPHTPLYVSPEFKGKSEGGLYGDAVEEVDWSTGEILKKIKELGIEKDTIVVFSSDNGPWLLMGRHGGSAGILREGKMTTFEGGMRVPTIAYWKGKIKPGRVNSDLATMMDWFPTFTSLAGGDLPASVPIDGKNITQVLFGKGKREEQDLVFFNEGKIEAIRSGDWKLKLPLKGYPFSFLRFIHPGIPGPHELYLFNIKDDPEEKKNLADQFPDKVKELKVKLNTFETQLGIVPEGLPIGKNMDYSGFFHVAGAILGKLLFILISITIVIIMVIKAVRKRK